MFQFAANNAWLISALPLLACVLTALFGFKLKGASHLLPIVAMVGAFLIAISLLVGISNGSVQPIQDMHLFDWINVGTLKIPVAISIDQLTALYLSFITGIGLLIFIYSANYMEGDSGYFRFFAYLSLFVFFMTVLVMGNNLVLLYLGWEGVGLASYLLIGYYYPRPAAVAAAKKAFITNRIGDLGLAIGIFLIYRYFGTLTYTDLFAKLHDSSILSTYEPVLKFVPFCLMLGAFGKSAQFPLHVWLPDAMEGPTPVSALIHAATMVTAGIYLIARTMPLFLMYPDNHGALNLIAVVGGFTAFMAATIALCQYDLKRIWAYSTLSQLGYMFMGLGVLASSSAVFHVFTHAFFKALLFLSAGSVMHAMGGELDIRKMSGIRRKMPITNIAMFLGCLALAGFPGFSGFFSKDEIIAHAINAPVGPGFYLGILGLIVALMTAFYTFRLYFKVFLGPLELPVTAGIHGPSILTVTTTDITGLETLQSKAIHGHGHDHAEPHGDQQSAGDEAAHGEHHGPSDGSPVLWLPLMILSLGAIFAGYLGFHGTGDWLHHFLAPVLSVRPTDPTGPEAMEGVARVGENVLVSLSVFLPIFGIAIAFYFYKINRHAAEIVAANLRPLVNFLHNRWYIDDVYTFFLVKPLWIVSQILSGIDRYVVDNLVVTIAFLPSLVGYSLKPTQRGLLQRYAVGMIAGIAAVILGVMLLLHMQ